VAADPVETLRGIYADWARGDFSAGWELLADDVQFVPLDDITPLDSVRGPENVASFLRDMLESFSDLRIEAHEFVEDEGRVLVRVTQSVVGTTSGASAVFEYWMQWVFDDSGRITRFGALREDPPPSAP
jgi:ketosteroid isomerase-like protein